MPTILDNFKYNLGRFYNNLKLLPKIRLSVLRKVFSLLGNTEKKVVIITSIIAITSALLSLNNLYTSFTKAVPAEGGIYREGIIGQPHYINPLLATSDADQSIIKLVFSGLYKFDGAGNVIPDLAEGFPTISPDGQEYTITLHKNAKWHNGKPVTADDVVFTIQTLQNPEFNSPRRLEWQSTTVEKVDDYTVKFKLKAQSAPFLNNLTLPIISQSVWSNIKPQEFALAQTNIEAVGTGPYLIKEVRKLSQGTIQTIVLESFSNYYNRRAYLDTVKLNFYENIEDVLTAIHGKQIDGFGFSPFDENIKLDESTNELHISQIPLPQYQAIFFNTSNKTLGDIKVRKALLMATDAPSIINAVYNGQGQLLNGPILPQHVEGLPPAKSTTAIDQAKALLDEAGWQENPETKIRQKKGKELSLTLSTNNFSLNTKTAEMIVEQWAKVGVKVSLNIQSTKELTDNAIRPRNFDMLLFAQKLGSDPDPFAFWHSSQIKNPGLNLSVYSNTTADRLISEARATTDKALRDEKYRQFQEIISADVPAIFLVQNVFSYALTDKIQGVSIVNLSDPTMRFYDLPNWYMDTKRVLK